MRLALLVVAFLVAAGCSTVDRRTYYQPLGDQSNITGPKEPFCGWTNIGGAPDTYIASFAEQQILITANQDIHPYLFGPWFASVVPVFPITWIIEASVEDQLEVELSSSKPILEPFAKAAFAARVGSKNISPTSVVSAGDHFINLTFPVKDSATTEFVLIATLEGKQIIEVPFKRTARWVWTQWTPNC